MHLRSLARRKPEESWQMCSTVGENSPSLGIGLRESSKASNLSLQEFRFFHIEALILIII